MVNPVIVVAVVSVFKSGFSFATGPFIPYIIVIVIWILYLILDFLNIHFYVLVDNSYDLY